MTEEMIIKINVWVPIITGFGGVVLGAVLSWLTNWLSQKGKITLNIEECTGSLATTNSFNGEFHNLEYKFKVFIYNSSDKTRLIRNIRIVFKRNNSILYECIPKDDSTSRQYGGLWRSDDVGVINIQAKYGIEKELTVYVNKNYIDMLRNANRAYLYYSEIKKNKKIFFKDIDYSNFFSTNIDLENKGQE